MTGQLFLFLDKWFYYYDENDILYCCCDKPQYWEHFQGRVWHWTCIGSVRRINNPKPGMPPWSSPDDKPGNIWETGPLTFLLKTGKPFRPPYFVDFGYEPGSNWNSSVKLILT